MEREAGAAEVRENDYLRRPEGLPGRSEESCSELEPGPGFLRVRGEAQSVGARTAHRGGGLFSQGNRRQLGAPCISGTEKKQV